MVKRLIPSWWWQQLSFAHVASITINANFIRILYLYYTLDTSHFSNKPFHVLLGHCWPVYSTNVITSKRCSMAHRKLCPPYHGNEEIILSVRHNTNPCRDTTAIKVGSQISPYRNVLSKSSGQQAIKSVVSIQRSESTCMSSPALDYNTNILTRTLSTIIL